MSKLEARQEKILEKISENGRMTVNDLSEIMNVSQVTIRKDLTAMEKEGLIVRNHGYASLIESEDINHRMDHSYPYKLQIAKRAADLVEPGETIMVESGSACALMCAELAKEKKGVSVITNSAFIADFIRKSEGIKVTLLGGEYQNSSQTLVGPMVRSTASQFHVDKFFLGTDGYTPKTGFMSKDILRAEAVKDMSASASKIIILTDSDKFGKTALVRQLPEMKIDCVITDERISEKMRESVEKQGIKLIEAVESN